LSLFSRQLILAVPLLAERFLAGNAAMWGTHFHYSLAIAPVLAMGAASGLSTLTTLLPDRRRNAIVIAATCAMLVASVAITRINSPDSVLSEMTTASFYTAPTYAPAAYRALEHVPAAASLATTDNLLAHASQRDVIYQLSYQHVGGQQYLLANVVHPTCCGLGGDGSYSVLGQALDQDLALMTPVYYDQGWLVARLPAHGEAPTNGVLTPMPPAPARDVDRLAKRWSVKLEATLKGDFACYERLDQLGSGAGTCFDDATRPFEFEQTALARAIHAARPTLEGGCSQLATAALVTTHLLALDLGRTAAAASSTNRAALPTALVLEGADQTNLDLTGQLERFLILCSPRGSADPVQ
jgi:hypothetical protein